MRDEILDKVKAFYEELPFNYSGSLADAIKDVSENPVVGYPDLDQALKSGEIKSFLEIGCGVGWLSNSVALHYGLPVKALDMTERAIARAKVVAEHLKIGSRTRFQTGNLYDFQPDGKSDMVVSIGVLPAVSDPKKAFEHLAGFVAPGKFIYLGFYHYYGRKVFRNLFDEILQKEGEDAAWAHYQTIHPLGDETLTRSWFRDQVLHPHEVWHTLEEVTQWLDEAGFRLSSTSINKFQPYQSIPDLIEMEKTYEALSYRANYKEKRYFPGFFTIMAQRQDEK